MSDKEIVNKLIANDERTIRDFFFVRCRGALTYIGRYYFSQQRTAEELIGAFYEFLSADDWHKLRIFKFTCTLNSYIAIIASRYFQRRRDREMLPFDDAIRVMKDMQTQSEGHSFFMDDINKVITKMPPLDRFLVKKILIEGEKPGDIMVEAEEFMRKEGTLYTAASNEKQFAGYIYTRYNRAKKNVMKQMEMLGYGKN